MISPDRPHQAANQPKLAGRVLGAHGVLILSPLSNAELLPAGSQIRVRHLGMISQRTRIMVHQ